MKKLFISAFALSFSIAALTGFAAEPAPETPVAPAQDAVVARVNGKEIKRAELNAAMQGLMMQFARQGRSVPPAQMDQFESDVLGELINRELVLQEASAKPPADLDKQITTELERVTEQAGGKEEFVKALKEAGLTPEQYQEQVRENLIVQAAMTGMLDAGSAATPEAVKEFYDKNLQRFQQPDLVRARHILLRVAPNATDEEKAAKKAQIDALQVRIKQGDDFAALAKEFSEDPGSAAQGGDLGFFPHGAMVPEFDEAAFTLETNQVSGVITTQFGYHVLQVTEKKAARIVPFDEVKEQLAERLKRQNGVEQAQKHIADLRKAAKVEVLLEEPKPAK